MKWRDLRVRLQGLCARLSKPHAQPRAGVRALIVALKPGNAGGAKGCRKVEMCRTERRKSTEVSARMATLRGAAEAPARSYAELSVRMTRMLMALVMEVVGNAIIIRSLHQPQDGRLHHVRVLDHQSPRG